VPFMEEKLFNLYASDAKAPAGRPGVPSPLGLARIGLSALVVVLLAEYGNGRSSDSTYVLWGPPRPAAATTGAPESPVAPPPVIPGLDSSCPWSDLLPTPKELEGMRFLHIPKTGTSFITTLRCAPPLCRGGGSPRRQPRSAACPAFVDGRPVGGTHALSAL
jgi:hypothetical protein